MSAHLLTRQNIAKETTLHQQYFVYNTEMPRRQEAQLPGEITQLLRAWDEGDRSALNHLMPFVLGHMRGIARRMWKGGGASALDTTALVHETYMRLAEAGFEANDREHFLSLVARIMRQILVDHARSRRRQKRGGGAALVTLSEANGLTNSQIEELLAIEELLGMLESKHARRSRIFQMRFFGGFSVEEIAAAYNISANTVIRDYRLACAWLRLQMQAPAAEYK